MKNISKIFLTLSSLLIILGSCKKDGDLIYFNGGTAPVLISSLSGAIPNIPLSNATKNDEAIKLSWTNPEYKFTTGISSQDVTYILEIDTTGSNFTNPKRKQVGLSKDLSVSISQNDFNDYLLNQLELKPAMSHNIELRIKSSLSSSQTALYSNVLKFTAIPYAIPPKVEVPATGELWITGDAAPSGWSNPLTGTYLSNQKFTQVSPTLYELTIDLPGGGGYKLLQEMGVWGSQYHMLAGGTWQGGDFEKKDSDPQFPGPPSSGTYKITVNFQTGKFSVVKL